MKLEEILKQAAKIISSEIEENYQLFLFSSRARKIHDEKSNIDIGIFTDSQISGKNG